MKKMGDKKGGQLKLRSGDWSAFQYTVLPSGNGYEWKTGVLPEPGENLQRAFAIPTTDVWLVESAGGRRPRAYQPLVISDLHKRLAKLALSQSPTGDVRSFANRYGFLGRRVRLYDPVMYPIDARLKTRIDQIVQQMDRRQTALLGTGEEPADDTRSKQLLADLNRIVESYPHLSRPWFSGESLDFWLNSATKLYVLIQLWERVELNEKGLRDYVQWDIWEKKAGRIIGRVSVNIGLFCARDLGLSCLGQAVYSDSYLLTEWSKSDNDMLGPICHYIDEAVSKHLEGVTPFIYGLSDAPESKRLSFIPDCLLSAIYLTFASQMFAQKGGSVFKLCPLCNQPFKANRIDQVYHPRCKEAAKKRRQRSK